MGTVTIAAMYGCGGSVIGPAVAKRLGLPFVDRAIPSSLAEDIHEPLLAALADDADNTSAVGRLLNSTLSYSGLFVGVPRARRAYIGHFYPRAGAWADPRHYHLVLDSTAISLDTRIEIIAGAAHDLFANLPANVRKPAKD